MPHDLCTAGALGALLPMPGLTAALQAESVQKLMNHFMALLTKTNKDDECFQ